MNAKKLHPKPKNSPTPTASTTGLKPTTTPTSGFVALVGLTVLLWVGLDLEHGLVFGDGVLVRLSFTGGGVPGGLTGVGAPRAVRVPA